MQRPALPILAVLLVLYGVASLVHFVHNAEFLPDYPNMPASWSRMGVYLAWFGMTAVGVVGWALVARGVHITGLVFLVVYAGLGLDSLGHYLLAPMSAHSVSMNATILVEVSAAALVLVEIARLVARQLPLGRSG